MRGSFYTPLVVHGRALCYSPAQRDLLIDRLHISLSPGSACIIQGANASGENDKDSFRQDLTLYGCLKLFCRKAGMPYQEVSWALRAVNLSHVHDQKYSLLSQGQRKRASLAKLLVVPRALWLLDEPTLALDTNSLTILEQIIHFHRMQGGCVVAATHTHIDIPDSTRIRLGDLDTL
ncbi:ABC transporter I family member 1 [Galdieria sulphuraria]|nr:ABC transporter I family member 1 [Galdieria sulphuraria]